MQVEKDIAQVSPETKVRRHQIEFKDPWDFEEVYGGLHDFARGYPFDPDAEDYLVHITTGTHVGQICWFLLTEARVIPGRLLQLTPPRRWKDGAPGGWGVIDLDLSRYDQIATRFRTEHKEAASFLKSGIETRNAAFNRMIDRIEQVAMRAKAPMLLTGPTGAGKSQLARRIYDLKHARHQIGGAFVEVNCATLRGDAAMSALFGHVKGAFTGATGDRAGLLRAANGGMLFLDEIGELGLDEQAMILRAIEEKRFLPVGADKEAQSDFQLIAGTNRDLEASVREGRFREDLLARLNLWTFRLPGLAERREDIAPNLDFELARHARATGDTVSFNKEAREPTCGSRPPAKRGGRPISASSARRSRAWRRWRHLAASPLRPSTRRSSACAAGGRPPVATLGRTCCGAWCPPRRSRRSTCSTGTSWQGSSAYVARRDR